MVVDAAPGMMLGEGDRVRTITGRLTAPYPKVDVTTDRRAANTIRRCQQWLIDEARIEAGIRGLIFHVSDDPRRWSPADVDGAELVLCYPLPQEALR